MINNNYIFNIQVDEGTVETQNNFQLSTVLQNTGPTITPVAPATCGGNLGVIVARADVLAATFDGVNGSSSTTRNTEFLNWSIRNSDGTLYTDGRLELRDPVEPIAGRKELWVLGTRNNVGSKVYNIRVVDGPGAVADCNVTFSISST